MHSSSIHPEIYHILFNYDLNAVPFMFYIYIYIYMFRFYII